MKVIEAQGGQFLAPANVGSHIQWHLSLDQQMRKDGSISGISIQGTIRLGDCNRNIDWGIGDHAYTATVVDEDNAVVGEDLTKIDNAIVELQKIRKVYAQAIKIFNQRRKLITNSKDKS